MRPARNLLLSLLLLAILSGVAALLGSRVRPTSGADLPASTFRTEPMGLKAFADALEGLGVGVIKSRVHDPSTWAADSAAGLVAVVSPSEAIGGTQRTELLELPDQGVSLLLAGRRTAPLLACLGLRIERVSDSLPLAMASGVPPSWTFATITRTTDTVVADSSDIFDVGVRTCRVPANPEIDTLLATQSGRAVVLRMITAAEAAPTIIVADADLIRNRGLRDQGAGAVLLAGLARDYQKVYFTEYLHGYRGERGSLGTWTLRWSRESPWGWVVWHLAIVGLVALLFAAIRFGPPVPLVEGRRRSIAEHVSALARALAATGGHRLAVGLLVNGLRRRLTPGARSKEPWQPWLKALGGAARNPAVRAAAARIERLDRDNIAANDVLSAANLVEDLWTAMRS